MDDINIEIREIISQLEELKSFYGKDLNKKYLFKKAGQGVLETMQNEAPERSGGLKESISFLSFKGDKNAIYVGARYGSRKDSDGNNISKTAPHAHLVEFGFIDRSGKKVKGNPFVKRTYDKTRYTTLNALKEELKSLQEKVERKLARQRKKKR